MALRVLGNASPNLLSKYRSTPSGSMGLDSTTARTPCSVFTAGNARPRSSTRNSSPRPCSRTFLSSFGVGLKMPNRLPLLCAVNPATAFPRDKASSDLNPNRYATTAAQSVNTGARLIRILFRCRDHFLRLICCRSEHGATRKGRRTIAASPIGVDPISRRTLLHWIRHLSACLNPTQRQILASP